MIVDNLFETIKRGMLGHNKGLSTGLPKLDKLTYGIQQGWMTLVGADTGAILKINNYE
jgi:replicative DNA helicase